MLPSGAYSSGQPVLGPPQQSSGAKRVKVCQTGEALEVSLDAAPDPNPFPAGALHSFPQDALISSDSCARNHSCRIMDSVLPLEPAASPPTVSSHPAEVYAGQILKLSRAPARSEIQHLFALLPKDKPPRGGGIGQSFACGMYCQGPLLGPRANTKCFALACSVLANFVRDISPDFHFTTVNLFFNVKTSPHMDSHNAPLPNLVVGISDFREGQVLLEDPAGSHVIQTADGNVPATALDVAGTHAIFDAYRLRHQTAAWRGDRLALVAFSVRNASLLPVCDLSTLRDLGFAPCLDARCSTDTPPLAQVPDSDKCLPSGAASRLAGKSLASLLFVEIFCGAGHLASAAKRFGIGHCIGVSSRVTGAPRCPVLPLDLKNEEQHELLWDVLRRDNVCGVHLSPPASDPQLCDLTARILKWCHQQGILVSVPGTDLWAKPVLPGVF